MLAEAPLVFIHDVVLYYGASFCAGVAALFLTYRRQVNRIHGRPSLAGRGPLLMTIALDLLVIAYFASGGGLPHHGVLFAPILALLVAIICSLALVIDRIRFRGAKHPEPFHWASIHHQDGDS